MTLVTRTLWHIWKERINVYLKILALTLQFYRDEHLRLMVVAAEWRFIDPSTSLLDSSRLTFVWDY